MVYHSNNPLARTNDAFVITTINAIAFIVVGPFKNFSGSDKIARITES
jgi:hypothetical protein